MSNVDWGKIKAEYLAGGISYRNLAKKYSVNENTLMDRARKEGWKKAEREVARKSQAKATQRIVSQRAKDLVALDTARSKLIHKLAVAIDKFPDISGNRMEQSMTEQIEVPGAPDQFGVRKKKPPKQKTVRVESDLLKMTDMLEKLMEMTGYSLIPGEEENDGFLDALNKSASEVTTNDADVPEDIS